MFDGHFLRAGQRLQRATQRGGRSFPEPLYSKWFKDYGDAHPAVQINYQSIGSGGGVNNMIDKTVDFAASDRAMTSEEMAKVDVGVQCLPMTAGDRRVGL